MLKRTSLIIVLLLVMSMAIHANERIVYQGQVLTSSNEPASYAVGYVYDITNDTVINQFDVDEDGCYKTKFSVVDEEHLNIYIVSKDDSEVFAEKICVNDLCKEAMSVPMMREYANGSFHHINKAKPTEVPDFIQKLNHKS